MPFNAAFVARLLPRLHWEALLSAAESVSGNGGGGLGRVWGHLGLLRTLDLGFGADFGLWGVLGGEFGFWADFGGDLWGFWGHFWVELGLCGDLGGEGSPHSCFIFAPSLISASSYFTSPLITPCPHYFMFLHINFFLNFFPLPPLINAPPPRSVTPQLCPPAPPHLMMLRRNSCFGCTTSCWR